jgi:uncharacterized protein (DUF2236 family)
MATALLPSQTQLEEILVGPDSVTWQRASDARLYLVMLYPLLLQVAHPTVGAGVRDYSDFERRPWDRLLRTIDYVSLLVYGGPEAAPAGRRLRELHKGFSGVREDGERYHALEPDAYAWVHATLIQTYVSGHAQFGTPMRPDQVEQFYTEYRRLGRLIGVRKRDLPPSWAGFRAYFDEMVSDALVPTQAVTNVLKTIRSVPAPPVPVPDLLWRAMRVPAARALWLGGAGLLSPSLRARVGVSWSGVDAAQFRALGALSRGLTPVLPKRLMVMGPAQLHWRRRAIARGPLGAQSAR